MKTNINEFIEILKETTGGVNLINVSQLSKAIGISHDRAREIVFGLNYLPNGKEKLYLVKDVAVTL